MTINRKLQGVRYGSVGSEYFQKRKLRRRAGFWLLWGLGVGAVISGEFSGWNTGLAVGGFGGLAIATVLMAIMYFCLVFCLAELSAALPHAGGFYSFTRNVFGPLGGYICGITELIEYVLTPAVIVYFIGSYLHTILPAVPEPLWWVAFYVGFIFLNMQTVELSLKVGLAVTIVAIATLLVFCLLALNRFDPALLAFSAPGTLETWFPKGIGGVFKALPYAIWFYLAIEIVPISAEEAKDNVQDVPRSLVWGMVTLFVLSILVLVLNSGIPVEATNAAGVVVKGAEAIGLSSAPVADGFKMLWDGLSIANVFIFVGLSGLIASFHCIIYGYGRMFFSLSRAGYLPRWISVTNENQSPDRALILGGVIGLGCTFLISIFSKNSLIGPALLNMAVSGAVISYALVMCAYMQFKIRRSSVPRPYVSPLGLGGAFVGTALAVVSFLACFADPSYQLAVWFVLGFLLLSVIYFLIFSRQQLVAEAPEEQIALTEETGVF